MPRVLNTGSRLTWAIDIVLIAALYVLGSHLRLFFPFTALLTLAALEGVDPAIEEAAEVSGASRWRVLRHVLLPLAMPGILAGSVLTFIEAFGAFSIPLIAGGDNRPLSVQIYTVSAIFLHWNQGAAMSVVMGAAQIIFLVTYFRLLRRQQPA